MKRYLSLLLVLLMCWNLFIVAFADGEEEGGQGGHGTETTDPVDPPHTHQYTEKVTKEATCTEAGEKTFTCSCGDSYTEPIVALGHSWGKWAVSEDGKTHTHTCTRDGCSAKESVNHAGDEWKKDEQSHWKKCSECGAEFGKVSHVFDKTKWEKDKDKHWQICTVCGFSTKDTKAQPHVFDKTKWEKDKDKHWQICTICGFSTKDTKAEKHKWDGGKVTKKSTCVQKGVKTYTCTVCGATKTETIPYAEHSWDSGNTTKQPTITEKGESTFKCIVCGKTATRDIDPLGLSMTPEELTTVTAAPENALAAHLDDEKWVILQGVTTEEEYARIQGGWPINVTLKVTDITDRVSEKLKQGVEDAAGKQKIYCFLDMALTKELYQDPALPVTETTEPVILSLTLPEEIREATSKRKERGFTVYRIDGESVEKVAAQLSEDGQSLRLQTNTFGTYALTYHDTGTGDFNPILLLYGAVGLLTLGGVSFLVYKIICTIRENREDEECEEEYDE